MSRSSFAVRVLDVVERIPRGKVMTYGDVAEYLGAGSPRQVGNVMSQHGHDVAWWRVVMSTGHPPRPHRTEALERLAAEGVPLVSGGAPVDRVDVAICRWSGE